MPAGFSRLKYHMLQQLSKSARASLQQELRPGEELHWAAPYGCLSPRVVRAAILGVALVWCITGVQMGLALSGGWRVWALLIPVLPLGITYVAYSKWREYKGTVCLLTNHRVAWLIVGKGCTQSLPLTQNMICNVVMRAGACGDIVFATAGDGDRAVFYNVPRVRDLVRQIHELAAGR